MKETEARVDCKDHQLLLYVEKNNGEYGPVETGSYLVSNYVEDFWEKQKKLNEKLIDSLCKGEISPVAYYMVIINISENDLAARLGISVRSVRKHQQLSHFKNMKLSLLCKYAEVFGVPVANMFQVLLPNDKKLGFFQKKTLNPFVTIIEIVEENR